MQIDGETVETDFILGSSKITSDGDCSQEIKRYLLLGRKVMTNLDRVLKSRDVTLPTKVHLVKAMVFPVVMYECESWTIKTFVSKVMFLLFNRLSTFLIAFLPRSKYLLISWLQSLSVLILEPKKIKSVTVSIFPSINDKE